MHRVATLSGELDHERKFEAISQAPSEILFISTADTELAGLVKIWSKRFGKKLGLFQSGHLLHPKVAENYVERMYCVKPGWRFSAYMGDMAISRTCLTR